MPAVKATTQGVLKPLVNNFASLDPVPLSCPGAVCTKLFICALGVLLTRSKSFYVGVFS